MKSRYSMGAYLTGAVTARTGDEMSGPALTLAGFAVAGSAAEASTLLAGVTIAAAVGGPVLGVLLDRAARPGRLLAAALTLHATGLMVILAGIGRLPLSVCGLIAVLTGLPGPALSGGWTAQLPRVVPRDNLLGVNALDAMTFGLAGLLGPALAGGAAQVFGAPASVAVSAVLIGLAVPVAWRLPVSVRPSKGSEAASVVRALLAGVRFVVRAPRLARATLTSAVACVGQGMLTVCLPLLGSRVFGGAGQGTMLLSCAAVSALTANAALARFPRSLAPDTVLWAGALVQAAALLLAATGRPAALLAAVLLAGIGEGPALTALFAVRHQETPEHLRGQVFTLGASLKLTGFALGAALAGSAVTWSLPGTLALAAGVEILAAPAFWAVTAGVRRTADPAQAQAVRFRAGR
ncbi:MFS transporter [Streptomyces sp. NPDC093984]|uniref:MFS transporter n=1 Tax=Streptomyces sp. NPDC093984 TaxID=3366052 RepID=UPI0037F239F5